jgi:tetratricopeptide (TPR) repeat protein
MMTRHFGRLVSFGVGRSLAILLLAWPATGGSAADAVILNDDDRIRGSLVSLSPDGVEIEDRDGIKKFSIDLVSEVAFDGEPESLGGARGLLRRRDPKGAAEELAKIEAADLDAAEPRIREEYEFLKLSAAAQAADPAAAAAAAEALKTFLARNPRSHHFYEGQEVLADILAKLGKFPEAAAAFGELDRGPPALRVRSAASKARLLLMQNKPAEAIAEFQSAAKIPTDPKDAASNAQKGEAELGVARCLALTGKAIEGVTLTRATIRKADPNDRDLLAAAFATLGACQRAAGGQDEDALISYLTVDLVYNTVPDRHAEALYNLGELWDATKQPERSRAARQALLTTYPDSPWAKKLGAAGAS